MRNAHKLSSLLLLRTVVAKTNEVVGIWGQICTPPIGRLQNVLIANTFFSDVHIAAARAWPSNSPEKSYEGR